MLSVATVGLPFPFRPPGRPGRGRASPRWPLSGRGNRLPGVPDHFWRLGLRTNLFGGLYLDADHTISSSFADDDANLIVIDAWGAGVTNLRVGWTGNAGNMQLAPFVGLNNLWDRRYVGSVTVNGNGGRLFEPAPGRVIYIGTEIGYRTAPQP